MAAARRLYSAPDITTGPRPAQPPVAAPLSISVSVPPTAVVADTYTFGHYLRRYGRHTRDLERQGRLGRCRGIRELDCHRAVVHRDKPDLVSSYGCSKVTATKTVIVTRSKGQDPKPPPGKTTPSLAVTSPSSAVVSTSAKAIVLKGTASDPNGERVSSGQLPQARRGPPSVLRVGNWPHLVIGRCEYDRGSGCEFRRQYFVEDRSRYSPLGDASGLG